METGICRQIFVKVPHIEFKEYSSAEAPAERQTDRQTHDEAELLFAAASEKRANNRTVNWNIADDTRGSEGLKRRCDVTA